MSRDERIAATHAALQRLCKEVSLLTLSSSQYLCSVGKHCQNKHSLFCVFQARMLHYFNIDGETDMVLVVHTERGFIDICSGSGGGFLDKNLDLVTEWFSSGRVQKSQESAPVSSVPAPSTSSDPGVSCSSSSSVPLPISSAKDRMRSTYLLKLQDALGEFYWL